MLWNDKRTPAGHVTDTHTGVTRRLGPGMGSLPASSSGGRRLTDEAPQGQSPGGNMQVWANRNAVKHQNDWSNPQRRAALGVGRNVEGTPNVQLNPLSPLRAGGQKSNVKVVKPKPKGVSLKKRPL